MCGRCGTKPRRLESFFLRHSLIFSTQNLPLGYTWWITSPHRAESPDTSPWFLIQHFGVQTHLKKTSQEGGKRRAGFSGNVPLSAGGRRGGARRPPGRAPRRPGAGSGRLGAAMVPSPGRNPKSRVWTGFREVAEGSIALGVRRTDLRAAEAGTRGCRLAPGTDGLGARPGAWWCWERQRAGHGSHGKC